jgi:hypothetical protein
MKKVAKAGTDVAQLLSQAAVLSRQAADLAERGAVNEALELEREADQLRKRARKIASKINTNQRAAPSGPVESVAQANAERGPGARANTIAALGELGVPSSPRVIAEYVWARYGTRIDHRALPSLRRDEVRSWSSMKSIRPVYVVPALEGTRFLPVRAKLALSDWALERRVIGPWSERVDHLCATIQIAKQVIWLMSIDPEAAHRLEFLLTMYATTTSTHDKPFDPAKVEQTANAELAAIGESDRRWRIEAAEKARSYLTEDQQLWGTSLPRIVTRSA